MTCDPSVFEEIPIFSLLDADERAVLAEQVELREFAPRQRIYKVGDPGGKAFIIVKGQVQVIVIDEDNQEVVIDAPGSGEIFGLASMLSASPHLTTAIAVEPTRAIEIDRHDLTALVQRKPLAGLDMLTMVGRHFQAAQELVRSRTARNPNEVIDEQLTFGQRLADSVARFGGSWAFIVSFAVVLVAWVIVNIALATRAWDPYPFILLNLFLSMLAGIQAAALLIAAKRADAVASEIAVHTERNTDDLKVLLKKNTELTEAIEALTKQVHEKIVSPAS